MTHNLFYYIAGMKESLKLSLQECLLTCGAKALTHGGTLSPEHERGWALVHLSRYGDVAGNLGKMRLVVYLSQDWPGCALESRQEYSPSIDCTYWIAGTESVIAGFASLCDYVKSNWDSLPRTDPSGWIAPNPENLIALSILCQGCLAVFNPAALGDAKDVMQNLTIPDDTKKSILSPMWWLEVLDPSGKAKSLGDLSEIRKEWPKPSDDTMADEWANMHNFLDALLTARRDNAALEPGNLAKLAEWAHLAVKARLRSVGAANKA